MAQKYKLIKNKVFLKKLIFLDKGFDYLVKSSKQLRR